MLEDPAGQLSHETPKTIQVTHSPGMLGAAEANPRLTTATAAIMIIRFSTPCSHNANLRHRALVRVDTTVKKSRK
jgi:hypothetical protein